MKLGGAAPDRAASPSAHGVPAAGLPVPEADEDSRADGSTEERRRNDEHRCAEARERAPADT